MSKKYLLAPGPTPVPFECRAAMAAPMIHHRAPGFIPVIQDVRDGLKYLFQTKNEVLTITSTQSPDARASVLSSRHSPATSRSHALLSRRLSRSRIFGDSSASGCVSGVRRLSTMGRQSHPNQLRCVDASKGSSHACHSSSGLGRAKRWEILRALLSWTAEGTHLVPRICGRVMLAACGKWFDN